MLVACTLLSACGTKMAYGYLDWAIQWKIRGLVPLTSEQKQQTKLASVAFHQWHQSTQLLQYADYLESLKALLKKGPITEKFIHAETDKVQLLLDQSLQFALPSIMQLSQSFTDEQVDELLESFKEDREEYRNENEPAELHQLMNEYYAVLVSVIEKHQGFIANFVGDAMLALWTGGEINESMCQKAYAAAIELQQRIADDPKLSQKLPTCVALHGGQFSLGNLGAKGHYEYSPVGDIINTVSRVEHFNRDLGTQFLCTEIIAKNLTLKNGMPELIAMGDHVFRNKTEPMTLYTTDTLKTN